MWENYNYYTVKNDEWSQKWARELQLLQHHHPLTIFTVSFHSEKESTAYATKKGFVHLHKENGDEANGYNSW